MLCGQTLNRFHYIKLGWTLNLLWRVGPLYMESVCALSFAAPLFMTSFKPTAEIPAAFRLHAPPGVSSKAAKDVFWGLRGSTDQAGRDEVASCQGRSERAAPPIKGLSSARKDVIAARSCHFHMCLWNELSSAWEKELVVYRIQAMLEIYTSYGWTSRQNTMWALQRHQLYLCAHSFVRGEPEASTGFRECYSDHCNHNLRKE